MKDDRPIMRFDNSEPDFSSDGKPMDMAEDTHLSRDGCNPVNRDDEMARAHDGEDLIPIVLPGMMSGAIPGAYTGSVPSAFFPGPSGPAQ